MPPIQIFLITSFFIIFAECNIIWKCINLFKNTVLKCTFFSLYVYRVQWYQGFPGGSDGESICLQCGKPRFDPCVGTISWRREWQLSPVFFLREFHGQRSQASYSSWVCKDLDMTEWLTHTHTHTHTHTQSDINLLLLLLLSHFSRFRLCATP